MNQKDRILFNGRVLRKKSVVCEEIPKIVNGGRSSMMTNNQHDINNQQCLHVRTNTVLYERQQTIGTKQKREITKLCLTAYGIA